MRYKTESTDTGLKALSKGYNALERFDPVEFAQEFQDPYGFVYLITCLSNNKVYVGITTKQVLDRFQEHTHSHNSAISNSIKKYGEYNFEIEILCKCYSLEELYLKEKEYISKYKSIEFGYNRALGGGMGAAWRKGECPVEIREKMRLAKLGWRPTAESNEKRSKTLLGRSIKHRQHIDPTCQCASCRSKRGERYEISRN